MESYNPLFDGVTTAAIAGRTLYMMANTQFRKFDANGQPTAPIDPLHILAIPLGDRVSRVR